MRTSAPTIAERSAVRRQGTPDLARQMLVRWAGRMVPTNGTNCRRSFRCSSGCGLVNVALEEFLRLARSGATRRTKDNWPRNSSTPFGSPALAAIRPLLSNEVLRTRPLFAQSLSLSDGDREIARWFEPNRSGAASAGKAAAWLALEQCMEMDPDTFARLVTSWGDERPRRSAGGLPPVRAACRPGVLLDRIESTNARAA